MASVVQWHTGAISYIDRVPVGASNIFITFRDSGDSGKGKLTVLDKAGAEVVAETVFKTLSTWYTSCAKLTNGNVVVAYSLAADSPFNGRFVIYSAAGSEVVSEVEFESGNTQYISVTQLNNGNFFIAYKDAGDSSKGKFVIHNASGTQVKAPTVFESNRAKLVHAMLLDNTNVMIVYQEDLSNELKFVIYDEDGTVVKAITAIDTNNSEAQDRPYVLSNSNVVISYNRVSGRDAYFAILDEDGNTIVGSTVYENTGGTFDERNSVTEFKGQIVFAIGDDNDDFGYKYIYTLAGVLVTGRTKFTTGENIWVPRNAVLTNGTLAIVYGGLLAVNGYIYLESAFAPPSDKVTIRRLVAAASNKIWYENV